MPYFFIQYLKSIKFVGLIILALLGSGFIATVTTEPTAAAEACYRYVDSTKIEYISGDCDKSGVTTTYTSTDGGVTYIGPQIVSGGARTDSVVCGEGTNKIVLSGGTAKLTKQNLSSTKRCEDGTTTTTITLKNWSGENAIEQAGSEAEINELISQFGDSLDPVKNKWPAYNCPTGVGGVEAGLSCGEAGWKNLVYECWGKRTSTANPGTASASPEVFEATMKDGFSSCLASKVGNGITKEAIVDQLNNKSISLTNIATAVDAAGQAAEEAATPEPQETEEPTTSCGIEGVGWLVCPVMKFLGDITDNAFSFLSETFLETRSDLLSNTSIQTAWSTMRNIANVAFVIAFLIIIFSQLTGQGVTNYGVKKMLPRLIISAVLVNVSFFICQLAVDLSNILGYSLNSILSNSYTQIAGDISGSGDQSSNGLGVAVLIGGILAGAIGIAMAVTMPVLLAVLLALIMIVLILVARTALIVLLTIISPLAFVAFLLPNTEQWFKKWYQMYFALLMVFPIIALVFGASTLAANVIKDASGDNVMMQIVAVGVAALPLFVVPGLLKGSLNAAGSIGTKLSGMSSKLNGRIGKKVGETSKLGAYNKARVRNAQIRRAQITGGVYKGKNPLARASSRINAALNGSRLTGGLGTQVAQQAASMANKLQAENIEAAHAQIEQANIDNTKLERLAAGESVDGINGKDNATRAAAMIQLRRRGEFGALERSWDKVVSADNSKENNETRRVVAQAFANSPDRPGFMGMGTLGEVSRSEATASSYTLRNLAANNGHKYSAEKIATTDDKELEFLITAQMGAGGIQPELKQAATIATGTDEINARIGQNRTQIEEIMSRPTR